MKVIDRRLSFDGVGPSPRPIPGSPEGRAALEQGQVGLVVYADPQRTVLAGLVVVCVGRIERILGTVESIGVAVALAEERWPDVDLAVRIGLVAEDAELAGEVAACFEGADVFVDAAGPGSVTQALERVWRSFEPLRPVTLFAGDLLEVESLDAFCLPVDRLGPADLYGPVSAQLSALHLELPEEAIVHPDTVFEGETTVWAGFENTSPAQFGAFSFSWSRITPAVRRLGRYCSIASEVIFGPGQHPMTGISTSSFMYLHHGPFVRHWRDVGRPEVLPFGEEALSIPPIEIGNDVWIGARASIMEGVTLGDGCIIGTNAIVTRDVPPYAIVGGSPARVIRYRFDDELIDRMLQVAWWQYDFTDIAHLDLTNPPVALERIAEARASGQLVPYAGNSLPAREVLPSFCR